jgi:hypothetical protein
MDLNQPPNQPRIWRCSWIGENSEQCKKWAQKQRLCRRHFVQRDQQQSLHATTEPAHIINNDAPAPVGNIADNNNDDEQLIDAANVENIGNPANNNDAAPVGNVGNHANNNDPPDVVDEQSNDEAACIRNIADSIDNIDRGINVEAAPVRNITD